MRRSGVRFSSRAPTGALTSAPTKASGRRGGQQHGDKEADSSSQSIAFRVMPAWIMAGAPTRTAVWWRPVARRPGGGFVQSSSAPSVDRVETDAGLDDRRCPDEDGGGGGGEQPGPDQTCACEHLSSSSVDRVETDAGLDHGRCPDEDGGGCGSQQAGTQEADSSRHLRLPSRRPSAAAATSVQPPTTDGPEEATAGPAPGARNLTRHVGRCLSSARSGWPEGVAYRPPGRKERNDAQGPGSSRDGSRRYRGGARPCRSGCSRHRGARPLMMVRLPPPSRPSLLAPSWTAGATGTWIFRLAPP